MNCRQIDEYLDRLWSSPGASVPQGATEHFRDCGRCRSVFEFLQARAPDQPLSPHLQSRIEKAVLGSLKPVSPLPPNRAFVLGFLAIVVLLLLGGAGVVGNAGVAAKTFWQFTGVAFIPGAGAFLLAVSLSWQLAPGSYHRVSPRLLIFSVAIAFLAAAGLLFPWRADGGFVSPGLRCCPCSGQTRDGAFPDSSCCSKSGAIATAPGHGPWTCMSGSCGRNWARQAKTRSGPSCAAAIAGIRRADYFFPGSQMVAAM